jgi:hypothetical protein
MASSGSATGIAEIHKGTAGQEMFQARARQLNRTTRVAGLLIAVVFLRGAIVV